MQKTTDGRSAWVLVDILALLTIIAGVGIVLWFLFQWEPKWMIGFAAAGIFIAALIWTIDRTGHDSWLH